MDFRADRRYRAILQRLPGARYAVRDRRRRRYYNNRAINLGGDFLMLQQALQALAKWFADLVQLAFSSNNIFWRMLTTAGIITLLLDLVAMIFTTKDD